MGFFLLDLGICGGIRVKGSNFALLVHGWRVFFFNFELIWSEMGVFGIGFGDLWEN